MSGKTAAFNGTATNAYQATVYLERNVSKVRVNISKSSVCLPASLQIDYANVHVQPMRIPDRTTLYGKTYGRVASEGDSFNYIDFIDRTGSNLRNASTFSSSTGGQIDSFYIYENYRSSYSSMGSGSTQPGGTDNAIFVKLTIPTIVDGVSKPDTWYYRLENSGTSDIYRNYIYILDVKVQGQSLAPLVTIYAQPWEDVAVDGSLYGTYLTTESADLKFDETTGIASMDFCTDAQAIYFNFSNFNALNPTTTIGVGGTHKITPIGMDFNNLQLAPAGFRDGQILLDQQHCGTFKFQVNTSQIPGWPAVAFSGNICIRAGNIIKCLNFPARRVYDAHFIVGDTCISTENYTAASVSIENGAAGWLKVSPNKLYTSAATTSWTGGAAPLYLHLDEYVDENSPFPPIRTGSITFTTASGDEKKLYISQLPAIWVGRYGYSTNPSIDDSIYTGRLYAEQLYEFSTMPYYSQTTVALPANNFIYNGYGVVQSSGVFDVNRYKTAPYFDAPNTNYWAINYCAYKNRGSAADGSMTATDVKWYLPSQAQLMALWVSNEAIRTSARPTTNFNYIGKGSYTPANAPDADMFWSATGNLAQPGNVRLTDFRYGNSGWQNKATKLWVRCVRSGKALNSMVKTSGTGTNGYAYIDFSSDMDDSNYGVVGQPHPYTKTQKTTVATTYPSSINVKGGGTEDGTNNQFVYYQLRVSKTDVSGQTTWANAISACDSYSETGAAAGTWRLPTQRELQAIWILQSDIRKTALAASQTFDFLSADYYWSATESKQQVSGGNYTNAWVVWGSRTPAGDAGNAPNRDKTATNPAAARTRCVHEE